MALNIIADFFNLVTVPFFDAVSLVMVIAFIIWEFPRTVKIISEEYTRGVYPEYGRVADILLFIIGIISTAYLSLGNAEEVVRFLRTPGITSVFLILMASIPLIIALGYFKRLFGCMEKHESMTLFIVHASLDLVHTLFYITLAILTIPVIGHLILGR